MRLAPILAALCLCACTRPWGKPDPPPSPSQLRALSEKECRERGDDTPKCVQTQYAANVGWYYYPKEKR